MTSATAFVPLLAPVLDDSMEVSSSPAGNHYDDEVLIDYDDYGTATYTEDERMIEDGEHTRPGTATDDMMEDAESHTAVKEETMHDDPVTVVTDSYIEDEELIDYSDDEYQDDTQVTLDDSTVEIAEIAQSSPLVPTENVIESENVDEGTVQQPGDGVAVEESTAHFLSAVAEDDAPGASTDEVVASVAALDDQSVNVDQEEAADERSRKFDVEEAATQEINAQALEADEPDTQPIESSGVQQEHDETGVPKNQPKFPAGLDTTAYFESDGPQTPSDTGIHPITLRHGDIVMPLFKSRVQTDGLLKDDNLASVSLGDLLDNCRHRLELKIGESLSADQELVLSFENMGLQLVEHSPYAFETSLDDILAIYLKLHRNDSTYPIPPLALSLSLQLKFTSSFNILKAAAQQGEGMSKFAYLRSGAEELQEYEGEEEHGEDEEDARHEEYQENEAAGEGQRYEGEDDFTENHADAEVSHLEEGQEYEEQPFPESQQESQQESHEGDASQTHDTHQDDNSNEESDEPHQADANAELEHYRDNGDQPGHGAEVDDGYVSEDALEHDAEELDVHAAQESEGHVRPESAASSTTVRGDLTNDPTGEYCNEEFIDFGDDDLTTEPAELHVDDGNGNFSALASEHEGEEGTADDADTAGVDDALDPTAQDLLNQQSNDLPDGDATEEDNAPYAIHDEAGYNVDHDEQGEDLPADDLDLNEEDLPAEIDEQFDTAFDLLEGHDFNNSVETSEPSQPQDGLEYGDDDIGFNDDVEEVILASNSPLGKRSFDEHVGENGVAEEQEPKKVRS